MSENNGGGGLAYLRLQIAYALEFAVWGCWSYALGTFCSNHGIAQGKLYAAFALGALFAPLVGPIADKKFAAQKVFAFMQLVCGASLLACYKVAGDVVANGGTVPGLTWTVLMFIAGLMFMPSIPLLNAIVFKHIPNKDRSPLVFIFGTLGWIAINIFLENAGKWCGFDGIEKMYLVNGVVAIALAVYALTLPNTPPSGSSSSDPFGFKALGLFKRGDFAIFILCATLVGIFGSNYYFPFVGQCFPAKGTLNQFSEIFFMAALAFAVGKIGLKWVLTLGMAAWGVRYYCFSTGNDQLALVGILCHGLAYAFLYTAAYMYGDKIAPKEMKASVQALIAFLLLGVAQTLSGVAVDEMKTRFDNAKDAPAATATESVSFSLLSVAYGQEDEAIADAAQETASNAAEAVQDAAAEAVDVAQETTSNVAEAVQDAAAEAVDVAQETASNAVEAVQDAAAEAVDVAQETTSNAVEAVQDAATEAVDAAQETASNVAESVQDTANDVVDAVKEGVDNTTGALQDAVNELTGAADATPEAQETEASADAQTDATAEEGAKDEFKLLDFKKVWNKGEWDKFNWKMIWGIPCVFCLFWALVFALLGKEPVSPDGEDQ